MQTSRITNASLFVTVLSACLGLLMTGAPAQAHARQQGTAAAAKESQAATDAPVCPDVETQEVQNFLNRDAFIRPLIEFVSDLKKLISIEKYELKRRTFEEVSLDATDDGRNMIGGSSSGNRWVTVSAQNAAEHISSDFAGNGAKFYHYDAKWNQDVAHVDVTFLLENSSLIVKASAIQPSPEQASKLAVVYNSYFQIATCQTRGEPEELFYQNTRALNDQSKLLVVTSLPRAALTRLLAE